MSREVPENLREDSTRTCHPESREAIVEIINFLLDEARERRESLPDKGYPAWAKLDNEKAYNNGVASERSRIREGATKARCRGGKLMNDPLYICLDTLYAIIDGDK